MRCKVLSKSGLYTSELWYCDQNYFQPDFNGRSLAAAEQPIHAYAPVSSTSLQWFKEMDGKQPGNPAKAAQAIIQAVESPNPPMRLALGTDAMSLIQEKLESVKTNLDAWQQVTVSTDYTDRNSEVMVG